MPKELLGILFLSCGTYTLENFKHALLEIDHQIKYLCFPTIPNRQYDPNGVAEGVTTQARIKQFLSEANKFHDLFKLVTKNSMVEKLATYRPTPEELIELNQYHIRRIAHLERYPSCILVLDGLQ